ncbi:hypothetical protein [Leptospira licerasiae]|uniref:Uncharacterized protein n=1 Tax=Leptospira licerasiae str. MMD4847 TaxID=1049971 RepID=A0ABP2RHC4_9LEPT|nr:hypothetical protein [Leptospira licerasiae]EIE01248.1 hypothetical protein LEP1GSC185_3815 [Leptospira licerasiae serovar Varillal str. VAR 010]EJZ43837.1 hypothetical protein LEP1GSC178_2076 [Leptospira licerasiae str. MMD4847]TGM88762.1 hypothetical protein EHR05_11160 [Leptospira licerasiae]
MAFWKRFVSRKTKVENWITYPGVLENSIRKSLHFLFRSSLEEIFPEDLSISPSALGLVRLPEEKLKVLAEEFPIEKAFPYTSADEFFSEESMDSIVEFIAGTQAAPSKNLILGILNQPEVQAIFSQGLEKVLSEFHKKINPLHGVFQVAGLEKQISQFLSSLLPTFTERIADFVSIGSGTQEIQTVIRNTLKILFQTGFNDLGRLETSRFGAGTDRIRRAIANDEKVRGAMENLYSVSRDTLLNHYRKETLKEFIGLSEPELDLWIGKIAEDVASNIRKVHAKRSLSPLVLDLLTDILG